MERARVTIPFGMPFDCIYNNSIIFRLRLCRSSRHDVRVAEDCAKRPCHAPAVTIEQLRGFKQLERVAELLSKLHKVELLKTKKYRAIIKIGENMKDDELLKVPLSSSNDS